MRTRNTEHMRNETIKLQLAIVFGLGFLIKVACLVLELSTVQASTVAEILLK